MTTLSLRAPAYSATASIGDPPNEEIRTNGKNSLRYLTLEEYRQWDALVDASPQGSLFCRSWWLEAIAGNTRVLGHFVGGKLIAGIPLFFETRFGFALCSMPRLTQAWGVVIEPLSGKTATVNSRQVDILSVFAQKLAEHRIFFQSFSPQLNNWLPFYWNGFSQTSRFTYIFDDLKNLDQLWQQMSPKTRNTIRKAEQQGITIAHCTIETVFDGVINTFRKQGQKQPFAKPYLVRLFEQASHHNSGACFAAIDQNGRVQASAFLVWDQKAAYYLVGGGDPSLRSSGAQSLLIWSLIKFSSERAQTFDFEGSVLRPIEHFFRNFGPRLVAYNWIMKLPAWLKFYLAARRNV